MDNFEDKINLLIKQTNSIPTPISEAQAYFDHIEDCNKYNEPSMIWMNDVEIFVEKYLKEHPLYKKITTSLFHKKYAEVVSEIKSVSLDTDFLDMMNEIPEVSIPAYKSKGIPQYDVFISHANKDKESLVDELNDSLKWLGISIFYDKDALEWGDEWKKKIIDGTKKSEFAIIVISENFFGHEWTETELHEFLNRQNRNGQKLILPILHNITIDDLKNKYPSLADIQAIDATNYSCDQIALLFGKQLIKRLKGQTI